MKNISIHRVQNNATADLIASCNSILFSPKYGLLSCSIIKKVDGGFYWRLWCFTAQPHNHNKQIVEWGHMYYVAWLNAYDCC